MTGEGEGRSKQGKDYGIDELLAACPRGASGDGGSVGRYNNACGLTIDQQSPITQDAYLNTKGDNGVAKGKRECARYSPTTHSDVTRSNLVSTGIERDALWR